MESIPEDAIWSHDDVSEEKKEPLAPREWKSVLNRILLALAMMTGSADNYLKYTTGGSVEQFLPPSLKGNPLDRAFAANHVCKIKTPSGTTLIDIKLMTPTEASEEKIENYRFTPRVVWFDYPEYTVRCTFSFPGDVAEISKTMPPQTASKD